ncbi:MAG: GNAT family N-acetyltransferase [Firmicutes bacterium]|nr:GNAT family N-acetyltransferase [Bacillota bacterium]
MKLNTIDLITFDKNNPIHLEFLKSLIKDESIIKRFHGFSSGLLHTKKDEFFGQAYFLEENNELFGFVDIGNYIVDEKSVYLRIAVDKNKRGKGYGKKILEEVSEFIFKNKLQVESIKVKIANDNIQSLNMAASCGYEWVNSDYYIKYNPYLNNNEELTR